jgi:hypothetical protein
MVSETRAKRRLYVRHATWIQSLTDGRSQAECLCGWREPPTEHLGFAILGAGNHLRVHGALQA